MKTFAGAMAAFFVIVAGTQIYARFLDRTTAAMTECVEAVISSAGRADWRSCRADFERFCERWSRAKKWLAVFIRHDATDRINETLSEIEMYIRCENQAETAARANVLKILLHRIPENERLSLENILRALPCPEAPPRIPASLALPPKTCAANHSDPFAYNTVYRLSACPQPFI